MRGLWRLGTTLASSQQCRDPWGSLARRRTPSWGKRGTPSTSGLGSVEEQSVST